MIYNLLSPIGYMPNHFFTYHRSENTIYQNMTEAARTDSDGWKRKASKYMPHQGKQEKERRVKQRKGAIMSAYVVNAINPIYSGC